MSVESVVMPSSTTSGLSASLHPLPILNISEHFTRVRLQNNVSLPFIVGALLGTQNGREVEIVNTFELSATIPHDGSEPVLDHTFATARREQYKQVFPSLEVIGWYTVSPQPTPVHIAMVSQFSTYTQNPLLLLLQPGLSGTVQSTKAQQKQQQQQQQLPLSLYEPTLGLGTSKTMLIKVDYKVETGEAERIAVDWSSKGGEGGGSLIAHLQSQRRAVQMLHTRIGVIISYVESLIKEDGTKMDYAILRSIQALVASLPASEHKTFREEFDQEYADVQLTAYLSTLTKTANILNDIVDKYSFMTHRDEDRRAGGRMGGRRPGRMGSGFGYGGGFGMDAWDRFERY
ncbi:hypothetical protein M408DRAFT_329068 [Serendipita vermifera MAFF 305830]|uniref:COP9 signalosome complex subunit 6 n=1 Tax=Serendipita vermifera MAFF 305830 TaxID=933852 RepID=A0A0C3AWY8_SERVB|nr:hypothetical protein M408DRAFT_329068 [Serendipita vermifera MAFF 305830]